MAKVTAIILTKNEENMIADCIDSVSFCDEIIVVDSNSTDRTAEIAKLMQAKVYKSEAESFAEMRNTGAKKAKYEWLLYVDADERVGNDLKESISMVLKQKKPEFAAYKIKRKNFYFGNHEWPHQDNLERLIRKRALKKWFGDLHETPEIEGAYGELEGFLLHFTHRDLSTMLNKTIEWSAVEAELRLKAQHPTMVWWRFPRVMISAFYDSYIRQKGYTVGTVGLLESMYQAFSMFITYARLWEMQQGKLRNET